MWCATMTAGQATTAANDRAGSGGPQRCGVPCRRHGRLGAGFELAVAGLQQGAGAHRGGGHAFLLTHS
jgi:hypothetical protein